MVVEDKLIKGIIKKGIGSKQIIIIVNLEEKF